LPHLWPTGSSWVSPSITARYFSSCPSDSTSRWTPCPPEYHKRWLQVRFGCIQLSPSCPFKRLHTFHFLRPARFYPRFRIWRSSFERQRDLNPPEQRAAQRALFRCTTPRCRAYGSYGSSLSPIGLPRFRRKRQRGLSVLAHGVSMHAWASTTPPGDDALAFIAHRHVAFRTGQDRRPPDCLFRSSMSLPAYAPVNASSAPSRTPSHDSDSRWLAIPFLATLSFATPRRFIPTLSARVSPPWLTGISSLTDPAVQVSRSGFLKASSPHLPRCV
jgi:hypothetical protein